MTESAARPAVQRHEGKATLPFAVEDDEGSDRLLVAFPRLRSGVTDPPLGLRRGSLDGIAGHRLFLGSDEDNYFGPERRLLGLQSAVELVGRETQRLGIPPENVVFFGTSMGAMLALTTGLTWGAGTVIAGGAPVLMGAAATKLSRDPRENGKKTAGVRSVVEAMSVGDGSDTLEHMDTFIFELAEWVERPMRVHLLTSPGDYTKKGVRRFDRFSAGLPNVEVTVHEGTYANHQQVGPEFFPLLRRVLEF